MAGGVLLLIGGEICHNYFANRIRRSYTGPVDVVVCHSGLDDFEFYYPIYAGGPMREDERTRIIDFIFRRNSSFARLEEYKLLRRPDGASITRDAEEFNRTVDRLIDNRRYEMIFSYGSPIIHNPAILAPDFQSFNIHIGLSRHYRGGDSNIFALAEGSPDKVGLTCHKLSEAIDEGGILFEIAYPPSMRLPDFDSVNHYLVTQATEKACSILQDGLPTAYSAPKGRLALNRELTARHILAAEDLLHSIKNGTKEVSTRTGT